MKKVVIISSGVSAIAIFLLLIGLFTVNKVKRISKNINSEKKTHIAALTKKVPYISSFQFNDKLWPLVIQSGNVSKPTIHYNSGLTVKYHNGNLRIYEKSVNDHCFTMEKNASKVILVMPQTARPINFEGKSKKNITIDKMVLNTCYVCKDTGLIMKRVTIEKKLALWNRGIIKMRNVTAPKIIQHQGGGSLTLQDCHFEKGLSRISSDGGRAKLSYNHFSQLVMHSGGGSVFWKSNKVSGLKTYLNGGDLQMMGVNQEDTNLLIFTGGGEFKLFGNQFDDQKEYQWQAENSLNAKNYQIHLGGGEAVVKQ